MEIEICLSNKEFINSHRFGKKTNMAAKFEMLMNAVKPS